MPGVHLKGIHIGRAVGSIIDRQAYHVLVGRQSAGNGPTGLPYGVLGLEIQVGTALVIGGQAGDVAAI